eukprot:3654507-Heterocapsa_arctica.AAC.1
MKIILHPDKTGLPPPGPTQFATELLTDRDTFRDEAASIWDNTAFRLEYSLSQTGVKLRWQEMDTKAQ